MTRKYLRIIVLLLVCCAGAMAQTGGVAPDGLIVNKQTGTSYTIVSLDRGRLVTATNAASIAWTLPVRPLGWYCFVSNRGAGTVTITPVSGFIDTAGTLSLVLTSGQGILIASDGTNYFTGARGRAVIAAGDLPSGIDAAKIADGSVSNAEYQRLDGVSSGIQTQIDGKQPLDSDLTTIAGLTATTDNLIVAVASVWASRTVAQVKTTLALDNVTNTSDANKPVSTAQQTALDLKANLASPTLSGTPAAPTAAVDTSTTQIATTAYVVNQGYAKLASPTFSGTPLSTTAAVDTNTTQIATTAYVIGQAYAKLASPTFTGTPTLPTGTIATTQSAADSSTKVATTAFVTTADNLKANLASPTFTGTPLSTTAAVDTNTTQIATTAYVVGQAYAKLASPALTGTPTVPTAAVDTNTTQAASTAYVVGQAYAKLASPTFTGTPTLPTGTIATTQSAGNSTTVLATTAFVTTADNLKANLAGPTFTGTVTIPTPFTLGAVSVISTGTQLNYLNAATGTTGTASTNVVFSASPTISSPVIANIAPGANFTITQNSVVPFTSVNSGAIVNTLYLTAGNVGIGITTPDLLALGGKTLTIQGSSVRSTVELSNSSTGTSGAAGSLIYLNGSTQLASISVVADGATNSGNMLISTASAGSVTTKLSINNAGAITLNSGLTNASGTPGSICYNTSTFEMTKNNALTCTVSSRAYKNNILDLKPLSAFDKLRPVEFAYRDQPLRSRWGFIAEEAGAADRRLADGYDGTGTPRSLDQNAILALTVKEVQKLKAIVIDLKAKARTQPNRTKGIRK